MEAPPERYSVHQSDFDPEIGRRLIIRVDGDEQDQVIEYDCRAGSVLRNKLDANGQAQVNPDNRDEVWTETATGNVTVEWRD